MKGLGLFDPYDQVEALFVAIYIGAAAIRLLNSVSNLEIVQPDKKKLYAKRSVHRLSFLDHRNVSKYWSWNAVAYM